MKSQNMYIIVFGFFIIKFQISASEPQFPVHIDLQKVGETIFNNENFNILKPTTHTVTDHFKEFMLRTENSNHPTKRVFIDNNGFRHNWSGFGEKTKSLRKTDLKHERGNFKKAVENNPEPDINTEKNNDTPKNEETTTILNIIQKNKSNTNVTLKKWLRQSKGDDKEKADTKPVDEKNDASGKKGGRTDDKNLKNNKERAVIRTTFFCPYLGTITMSSFLD